MQQGRGGMGSHKHGISHTRTYAGGKSPKLRHYLKREAEKVVKRKHRITWFESISALFKGMHDGRRT